MVKRLLYFLLVCLPQLSSRAGKAANEYDVVVYGGTPGGVASAVAASRTLGGKGSVLLIEQTKHVGGLNTSGINTAESERLAHR